MNETLLPYRKKEKITYKGQGAFEKDGRFYMHNKKNIAEIPEKIFRLVRVGLYANERIKRDLSIPKLVLRLVGIKTKNRYVKTKKIFNKTNCHKTAFFATMKPGLDDDLVVWSGFNEKIKIPNLKPINSCTLEDLKIDMQNEIGNEVGIVQIISDEEVKHSFLIKKGLTGDFLCFHKEGYGNGKFDIVQLAKIYNKYENSDRIVEYQVIKLSDFERIVDDGEFDPTKLSLFEYGKIHRKTYRY